MKRLSFGKNKRLVSDKQFKAVLVRKMRVSNGLLTLYMAENKYDYPRLGISVGKSCGNAVMRNRWKRLLREAFRQNQGQIPSGFDYLIMISNQWLKKVNQSTHSCFPAKAKRGVKPPTLEQIKNSFLNLVDEAARKIG
ncbi:MAG: ribonuclease P protein component [Planctomycetes bacterium RBG_13_44_8b]|nr:MAG: ribonuclease P protein component [Planctomycetes bacterium RBG_13_44_8b]